MVVRAEVIEVESNVSGCGDAPKEVDRLLDEDDYISV